MIGSRRDFVGEVAIKCLDEMYRSSQPSITWEEVIAQWEENPDRRIWTEHYLPQFLYEEIMERYLYVYRISEEWTGNINTLIDYLEKGGSKDKYIEAHTDEYGYHPGYRGYEKVPPINQQIQEILKNEIGDGCEGCCDKIVECVMNTIKNCQSFFKFDRMELGFRFMVGNQSPCSNIETVRELYKDNPDIIINEVNEEDEEDE